MILLLKNWLIVAVALALPILVQAERLLGPTSQLRPFVSDGCSSSPDVIPWSASLVHCCIVHDLEYWIGGPTLNRTLADEQLKACIWRTSNSRLVATVYHWGVVIGGAGTFAGFRSPFPWKWAYGWSHPPRWSHQPNERSLKLIRKEIWNLRRDLAAIYEFRDDRAMERRFPRISLNRAQLGEIFLKLSTIEERYRSER